MIDFHAQDNGLRFGIHAILGVDLMPQLFMQNTDKGITEMKAIRLPIRLALKSLIVMRRSLKNQRNAVIIVEIRTGCSK